MVETSATLCISFGNCPSWCNSGCAHPKIQCLSSLPCWPVKESPLAGDRWAQRWIYETSMAIQSPFVEQVWKPSGKWPSPLALKTMWITEAWRWWQPFWDHSDYAREQSHHHSQIITDIPEFNFTLLDFLLYNKIPGWISEPWITKFCFWPEQMLMYIDLWN